MGLGEEGAEVAEEIVGIPVLGADDFAEHAAVAADDVGFGKDGGAVIYVDGF